MSKYRVILEVDVHNTTTESEGRETAFALVASLHGSQAKKGRPASGPRATLSGISVESLDSKGNGYAVTRTATSNPDVME